MILLDTNVVSEVMRDKPDPAVKDWLSRQPDDARHLSAISEAELLFGIGCMPSGRRRDRTADAVAELLTHFEGRILAFDSAAAAHFARLASAARAAGRTLPSPDGYIAAIAAAHGMTVATRDTAPFIAAGVPVVNPWQ